MPRQDVELQHIIRSIREMFEFAGHSSLAEQMAQLELQVKLMAEDNASLSARVLAWERLASTPIVVDKVPSSANNEPVGASLLTRKQREVLTARLAFVREIERLAATGIAKTAIRNNLVEASQRGGLAPHLALVVDMANDRSGGGKRGLSSSSLQRWCLAFAKGGEAALAPARPGPDLTVPAWAPELLAAYRRPSKPTLTDAYRQVFGPPHRPKPGAPSIYAVRRFVKKLSTLARARGRKIEES
jgi:putative transposase